MQTVTLCGDLYGTIFGTFPKFSAPLWAPFGVAPRNLE
jgi:hypothetical protein